MKDTIVDDRIEISGLTIDGPDSRDIDDAFWLEKDEKGFLLHISISDVGDRILPDSSYDQLFTKKRSCTTHLYF